jgi:pyruvate dehydrogenase E1 component
MLMNAEQIEALRCELAVPEADEWAPFAPDSPEGRLCAEAAARLFPAGQPAAAAPPVELPASVDVLARGMVSTQDTFGRLLTRLADAPELRRRIVTASPDVSVSTNLAGWINKVGVFDRNDRADFETEGNRLLKWTRGPEGQHIELGISEMNLFMLLGMFGLSAELCGEALAPIGTVYDPFVLRGLDALVYALYSNSRFIFAGTPSGITLAPEGGAHQSSVTPSLGMELPRLDSFEPTFAREVEWILLEAIRQCFDRAGGRATYLRLTTRPVDQALLEPALARLGLARLRQHVLRGGYRLMDWREAGGQPDPRYAVHLFTSGAVVPEVAAAAAVLHDEGVAAVVHNLTSPRRLFESWKAGGPGLPLDWMIDPGERGAPIVTVQDGASHTLAWLGSALGAPLTALGVDEFGESGTRAELYQHHGLDTETIVEAAFRAVDSAAYNSRIR